MPEGGGDPRVRKHSVVPMLAFGAISSAIMLVIVYSIHWFPTDASQQAKRTRTLYNVLLFFSVPIFVMVVTVIIFSVLRYRMRPGEELKDGPPIHGNTRLEVVWTVAPAILIVGLCTYAVSVLSANEASQKNTLTVDVTARQWAFEYAYPQPGGKAVYSPFLYLPNARPVVFKIRSLDVIHSFFVPEFSEKIDAVPGITTQIRVTPTRVGSYTVECTELCGAGHAFMRSTVYVMKSAAFAAWMSKQTVQAQTATGLPGAAAPPAPAASGASTPTTTSTPSTTTTSTPTTPATSTPSTTPSTTTSTTTTSSTSTAPAAGSAAASIAAGKAVFLSAGCSGCHTLAAAASTGVIGPNLDQRLPIDCKTRHLAIKPCVLAAVTSPYTFIPPGYTSGVMPSTFSKTLGPTKIQAVVDFIASVTK